MPTSFRLPVTALQEFPDAVAAGDAQAPIQRTYRMLDIAEARRHGGW